MDIQTSYAYAQAMADLHKLVITGNWLEGEAKYAIVYSMSRNDLINAINAAYPKMYAPDIYDRWVKTYQSIEDCYISVLNVQKGAIRELLRNIDAE